MSHSIVTHPHAVEDLATVWRTDSDAAYLIAVLIQELEEDPDLLSELGTDKFVHETDPRFNIRKWVTQHDERNFLWRISPYYADGRNCDYRIIYAYDCSRLEYVVLAVVEKEAFKYDVQHPISRRIAHDYLQL